MKNSGRVECKIAGSREKQVVYSDATKRLQRKQKNLPISREMPKSIGCKCFSMWPKSSACKLINLNSQKEVFTKHCSTSVSSVNSVVNKHS